MNSASQGTPYNAAHLPVPLAIDSVLICRKQTYCFKNKKCIEARILRSMIPYSLHDGELDR